jgi:ComF family protein
MAGIGARLVDALVSVILAPECAACEQPLDLTFAGPICPACWSAVRLFDPATPQGSRRRHHRRRSSALTRSPAAGPYDGALRLIIHAFKYGRRRSLAAPLGALVAGTCAATLDDADVCVPVPLHWRRRYTRGFNQADDLAATLGPPVVRALRRRRHTHAQASLHAGDRQTNVRDAFAVTRRGARAVTGAVVVLVDDVQTTGATLEACARALRSAGAREVRAVTIARAEVRAG